MSGGSAEEEVRLAHVYILLGVLFYLPEGTVLDPVSFQDAGFAIRFFQPDHKLDCSPITTSDGRLVGLLLQNDVISPAGVNR